MEDVRAQLKRSQTVKQVNRTRTRFITLHYNGPEVTVPDLALLQADARFHVDTRGWDGLAYTYAVGRTSPDTVYQCRDYLARLNHSGVALGNSDSLAVLLCVGEGQTLSAQTAETLEGLLDQLLTQMYPNSVGAARYVLGHRAWPRATACPGAAVTRWLLGYYVKHSGQAYSGKIKWPANIRDEPSVLSHRVGKLSVGEAVQGTLVLANPVQGDARWLKLDGTTNYIHGSVLT